MKARLAWLPTERQLFLAVVVASPFALLSPGCADRESGPAVLTADLPLHLEDHLDAATIVGSKVPAELPAPIEWRFDEPQTEWKALAHRNPHIPPLQMTQTEDALRITLSEAHRHPREDHLHGVFYVPLPNLERGEWGHVVVRARTSDDIRTLVLAFNLGNPNRPAADQKGMFQFYGQGVPVIQDGSVHTYVMRADWSPEEFEEWEDPWQELGFAVNAREPASIDLLSVSIISKEATYAHAPVGVRTEVQSEAHRRTLYTHTPGRLEYRVQVPEAGRLDVGLGVLRGDAPVNFRITVQPDGGEVVTLIEETYADQELWAQRSVDLSSLARRTVTLTLEADSDRTGTVALWAAPTLSGKRATDKPNIIFYIIDGGGADYMSVYGYNRRTTPNLEHLAAEGAIFEHAYSNSTWTKPSTPSFMSSLQHSVLGGYKTNADPLPDQAVTMAQHLHRAGYQTAVFTSNAYAGTMSSLDRGVDALREASVENNSVSSRELHQDFRRWRQAYPGEPYWVHFQTTDVHWPWNPVAPFAGLFVDPESRERFYEWERRLAEVLGLSGPRRPARGMGPLPAEPFEKASISHVAFYNAARGLYDETMTHNDYQLGRLMERLKASGEWEHTLFILAADHGYWPSTGLFDPLPPEWAPNLRSFLSRVPLIVVWPERIAPGQHFSQAVSMIDILPTILDLVGVPMPEVMQGQSLEPLLLGKEGWEPRPVILDEFYFDWDTGELSGLIEVVDGRWGASLEIDPDSE
ncbi:MAG: sulfatase, partial [Acidobacteria bacterium]|nr:sulfatase [Acidobacteriota bacterium]